MNSPHLPVLALVVLASSIPPFGGTVTSGTAIGVPTTDARVATLEKDVAALQATVKALSAHTHTVVSSKAANYYMSIGQLRDAMVPHSSTDINVNWIPIYVSNGQPAVGGVRLTTSTPTTP